MDVHMIHDLGEEELIKPYEPVTAACGERLRRAHEVKRPDSDDLICPRCLSISRRNKYQNYRCALDMRTAAAG